MKRSALLLTTALAPVLYLGGCGSGSSETDGGTDGGVTDSTTDGGGHGGVSDGGTDGGVTDAGTAHGGTDGGVSDAGTDGGVTDGGTAHGGTDGGVTDGGTGGATDGGSYQLNPPESCYNQFWVAGCQSGVSSSACGGQCAVANACSPPESSNKSNLPMTFACPRFMLFSDEMKRAAKDDTAANSWGDSSNPPFNYGVVGHDVDSGGLDTGASYSTCCQCYQLVFERPEPGSPQPPDLPIPKSMIVQSFNTAAGGGKNFDIFMGAGGFGAFNACVSGSFSGSQTTTFGHFMYSAFPGDYNGQGGIKFINLNECKVNGASTVASLTSSACQNKIGQMCDTSTAPLALTTRDTRSSCKETNLLASAYHQNWNVRAKKVECPTALTRVTGCRLAPAGLPQPNPMVQTVAGADSTFLAGYTTTTMQDCCKPSCAWKDYTSGAGLTPSGNWTSFYSCDQNGVPITSATP